MTAAPGPRAGQRTPRLVWPLFLAASLAAVLLLLVLARPLTFRGDEWALIDDLAYRPSAWLAPHGAHPIAAMLPPYALLLEVVGLRSYLPYILALALVHLCVAGAVLVAVRQQAGPWIGLGAAVIVLFLGYGYENLLWAFQIGYVGGIAAGLWGLIALGRAGDIRFAVAAALLFSLAVMSTLTGAVMLGVAWVDTLVAGGAGRQRRAVALIAPSVLLAVWWLLASPAVEHGTGALTTDPMGIAAFVVVGVIGSFGALTGLGPLGGVLLAVTASALVVWDLRRGRRPVESIGPGTGILAFFVLAAVSRGILGIDVASSSRYVYVGAILSILVIAPLVGGLVAPARWPRLWMRVAVVAAFEIAVLGNVLLLVAGRDALAREATVIRAEFALLDDPSAGATTSSFVYRDWTPAPPRLLELRQRHGDIARPGTGLFDPPPVPSETLERVRVAMRTGRIE